MKLKFLDKWRKSSSVNNTFKVQYFRTSQGKIEFSETKY